MGFINSILTWVMKKRIHQIELFMKYPHDVQDELFKRLIIEGHTCSVGNEDYNRDLSKRRAETIRKLMIEKFHLHPSQIVAQGFGEARPITDNGNFQGRQFNRRVEFKIYR